MHGQARLHLDFHDSDDFITSGDLQIQIKVNNMVSINSTKP